MQRRLARIEERGEAPQPAIIEALCGSDPLPSP